MSKSTNAVTMECLNISNAIQKYPGRPANSFDVRHGTFFFCECRSLTWMPNSDCAVQLEELVIEN